MPLKHYQQLIAWQKAMELAETVYKATATFPREEIYGLTSQLRRAAVSIPSNIAEGQGRGSAAEFAHGLRITRGSLFELETQTILSERMALMQSAMLNNVLDGTGEVGRLINGLLRSLE
jgi:four helix bundle protein